MQKLPLSLKTLIWGLFIIGAYFLFNGPIHQRVSYRSLASVGDCSELINETMLLVRPPPRFKWWQHFTQMSTTNVDDFSLKRMNQLESFYSEGIENGDSSLSPEASAEGLMAFIRATKNAQLINTVGVEEVQRVSMAQKKALHRLLKKLSLQRSWQFDDINNLSHELYMVAYGPENLLGSLLSFSMKQRDLVVQLATEDLAKRGMYESFSHFRFLKANPNLLRRFAQTKFARGLKVSLLNLPMLLGAPPLYLPKIRAPKLSQSLADDLLSEGLTDEILKRINREIGPKLLANNQYESVRKAYMYGVMVYLVMAQAYETYQVDAELDDNQQLIAEAQEETSIITQSLAVLEDSGVDVFSEEEVESGNIFCQNLRECFEAFSVSESDTESEGFSTCQSVIDPGNQCTSL
jgi:hypothetical protein